jgi:hypothetical protein
MAHARVAPADRYCVWRKIDGTATPAARQRLATDRQHRPGWTLLEVSAEQSDQLGYAPGALSGQGIEQVYTADSVRALHQLFANPLADERVQDLELTRHNGGLLPVLASGLLQWRDGRRRACTGEDAAGRHRPAPRRACRAPTK